MHGLALDFEFGEAICTLGEQADNVSKKIGWRDRALAPPRSLRPTIARTRRRAAISMLGAKFGCDTPERVVGLP